MKQSEIVKPVGLETPCEEIEHTCGKAQLYKRCGLRPNHLVIPLDAGSGRTTFLAYMTGRYREAGVLEFASGLDDYIEIAFDGTLSQLKQAFAAIDAASVYTNEYCNIVGMDISGIAAHLGETQFTEFMKNCKRVCGHACVVFFVHTVPNRNEEKLLEKLCETIGNIRRLTVEPYTKDDMCALIVKRMTERGIEIRHAAAFCAALLDMVSRFDVSSVKDANAAADALLHFADFSGFTPVVDENSLKSMIDGRDRETERREVK